MALAVCFSAPACGRVPHQEPQDDKAVQATEIRQYRGTADPTEIANFAWQRFFTRDRLGRRITFYLSRSGPEPEPRPLVVCLQGSGSQSAFLKVGSGERELIVASGVASPVRRLFRDQVRVLVVEKPGVPFLFQPTRPGSAEEGPAEFNREFSLERWVEAVNAATLATLAMSEIDGSRVLALGHSEGGQVAAELAAVNDRVTHVAVMAGGGPTQLFDLMQLARQGDLYDPQATPQERVDALLADWQKVLDDPDSGEKFILGHSHLRWSSFLKSSPVQAVLKSRAAVFIAQGTADTNSLPASAEVLYAELLARGRPCHYERVEGGNHGFMTPDDNGAGWHETNKKAVEWFLRE